MQHKFFRKLLVQTCRVSGGRRRKKGAVWHARFEHSGVPFRGGYAALGAPQWRMRLPLLPRPRIPGLSHVLVAWCITCRLIKCERDLRIVTKAEFREAREDIVDDLNYAVRRHEYANGWKLSRKLAGVGPKCRKYVHIPEAKIPIDEWCEFLGGDGSSGGVRASNVDLDVHASSINNEFPMQFIDANCRAQASIDFRGVVKWLDKASLRKATQPGDVPN